MKRFLLFAAALAGLLILLRRLSGSLDGLLGGRARPARRPSSLGEDLVRDKVCNTFLPKERALTIGTGSATSYFCSEACLAAHRAGRARDIPESPEPHTASSARAR